MRLVKRYTVAKKYCPLHRTGKKISGKEPVKDDEMEQRDRGPRISMQLARLAQMHDSFPACMHATTGDTCLHGSGGRETAGSTADSTVGLDYGKDKTALSTFKPSSVAYFGVYPCIAYFGVLRSASNLLHFCSAYALAFLDNSNRVTGGTARSSRKRKASYPRTC